MNRINAIIAERMFDMHLEDCKKSLGLAFHEARDMAMYSDAITGDIFSDTEHEKMGCLLNCFKEIESRLNDLKRDLQIGIFDNSCYISAYMDKKEGK